MAAPAVLNPEKERLLRSALASGLFGLNAAQIDALNQDEAARDRLVDEFAGYGQIWQQQGVLPMLRRVLSQRKIAENLLAGQDGERRLTDIMHISELLQETSLTLENEHARCAGWHNRYYARMRSQKVSRCGWKVISIWFRFALSINPKDWNTRWCGCRLSVIFRRVVSGFIMMKPPSSLA